MHRINGVRLAGEEVEHITERKATPRVGDNLRHAWTILRAMGAVFARYCASPG